MNLDRNSWETRAANIVGHALQNASWTTCRRTGWWFGILLFKVLEKRRQIAINNVRRAFPELSEAAARQIARRSVQNAAMTLFEFVRMASATPQDIRDYALWDGLDVVLDTLKEGQGAVLLTAHLGNWEVMGALAAQEFPIAVVARPTSNAGMQEQILRVRAHNGLKVISKHDTGRASLDELKKNHTLAILPDQYAGPSGLMLPFFGHPTRMNSSLTRLAMMSGAPIIPGFGVRRRPWLSDGRIVAHVGTPYYVENERKHREEIVRAGTLRMIGELENVIRHHPDQWLWLHRRWRAEDLQNAQF